MLSGTLVELAGASVVLLTAVAVGITCHELLHALAMTAAGVPCKLEVLPDRDDDGLLRACLHGRLATVTVTGPARGLTPWQLRASALMPLLLAAPVPLVLLGVLPDPVALGDPYLQAAAIGWLGCALPSPQDFSLFWHPREALAHHHQ